MIGQDAVCRPGQTLQINGGIQFYQSTGVHHRRPGHEEMGIHHPPLHRTQRIKGGFLSFVFPLHDGEQAVKMGCAENAHHVLCRIENFKLRALPHQVFLGHKQRTKPGRRNIFHLRKIQQDLFYALCLFRNCLIQFRCLQNTDFTVQFQGKGRSLCPGVDL